MKPIHIVILFLFVAVSFQEIRSRQIRTELRNSKETLAASQIYSDHFEYMSTNAIAKAELWRDESYRWEAASRLWKSNCLECLRQLSAK